MKYISIIIVFHLLSISCQMIEQEKKQTLQNSVETFKGIPKLEQKPKYSNYENNLLKNGFQDVQTISEDICVQLGYTTADNFTGVILYDSIQHAFLRQLAYKKLKKAHSLLQKHNANYTFLVFDALRPRHAQHVMWKIVEGTSKQRYVANPYYGSVHNYGLAIDLTIYHFKTKTELNMGTSIDHLGRAAEYRYNKQLVKEGVISKEAVENRKLLRSVMLRAGFHPINSEWWHFNALSKEQTRAKFEIVE